MDYNAAYKLLFHAVTLATSHLDSLYKTAPQVIGTNEMLKQAQRATEEMYISAQDIPVSFDIKNKPDN